MQPDNIVQLPRFKTLTARFGLIFCAITLALVMLLSATLFNYFRTDVESSLLSSFDQTVNANAQTLDDLLTRIDLYMNIIADGEGIFLDSLRQQDSDILPAYNAYLNIRDALKSNLGVAFGSLTDECSALFIVDHSMPVSGFLSEYDLHSFYRSIDSAAVHISLPDPYLKEDWYQQAQAQPNVDHWFTLQSNPQWIYVVRHLTTRALYNGRVEHYTMGSIVLSFNASWLESAITQSSTSGESLLLLLDGEQQILYGSVPGLDNGSITPLIPDFNEGGDIVHYQGEACYLWRSNLRSNLTMITLLPRDQINALASGTYLIAALSAAGMALLGVILVFMLSRYATEPIRRLAQHMQRNRLQPIPRDSQRSLANEVAWLYDAFNSQIDRINTLIEEIRDSEQQERETELHLLQAQINPHFVCNTLNSVSSRALLRGDDDLAEILCDLSEIVRYNLRDPAKLTSLQREMDIVQRYLNIREHRDGDPRKLLPEIADDCLLAMVPKMIIQPIVENAVSHTDNFDSVSLSVYREGERLLIEVRNHSSSLSAERINNHLAGLITLSSHSTGLGVRNTAKRLSLTYGGTSGYGLTFIDLPDGMILARIVMPYVEDTSSN